MTIFRDQRYTRTVATPGRSYHCGCDARTDGPDTCRVHDSPRVPMPSPATASVETLNRAALANKFGAAFSVRNDSGEVFTLTAAGWKYFGHIDSPSLMQG